MIPALHADYSGDGWNRGTNDFCEFRLYLHGVREKPKRDFGVLRARRQRQKIDTESKKIASRMPPNSPRPEENSSVLQGGRLPLSAQGCQSQAASRPGRGGTRCASGKVG